MKKVAYLALIFMIFEGCTKPTPFEFRGIQNIQLQQMANNSPAISATLSLFNPNHYTVQLKKVDADIYVNGQFLSHYKLDTLLKIPGNAIFNYNILFPFDAKKVFNNVLASLFNQQVLLEIKGISKLGRSGFFVNVPFDFSSKQHLPF
ncbi:LEA type 2 family protein [Arachidicoccus soli]|uniref:Late embryogenesis abundant protein LEA-2 subgroup domain-containing protein n=1 Tax=Arachidicoccus soli TaxID=2341117 RepID=A0A386HM29_9BACT|nr:LEA type 2 family protein [Arachidicoccus soli]AYD46803.1 hypothetical protein D6B99_03755 [Arachidicoccus soli]